MDVTHSVNCSWVMFPRRQSLRAWLSVQWHGLNTSQLNNNPGYSLIWNLEEGSQSNFHSVRMLILASIHYPECSSVSYQRHSTCFRCLTPVPRSVKRHHSILDAVECKHKNTKHANKLSTLCVFCYFIFLFEGYDTNCQNTAVNKCSMLLTVFWSKHQSGMFWETQELTRNDILAICIFRVLLLWPVI